ncbi:hypothetical protein [Natronospira bacteriovora]|uniref:Secreted protein n=1 Tax=Natronospira bacteriovora TaxID=3069753 RepID=A0ABU0W9C0_9GAMM|nr:hypothetical protein [Natronospira sp. AB-CW4]MDQ2070632.1 hypothetical protein [Natronospira sp. AB-CW4]
MIRVLSVLPLLCLLAACATSGNQATVAGPVSVEALLSDEEFRSAGLDRLDAQELEALNLALTRALGDGEVAAPDEAMLAAWQRSEEDEFATFGFQDEHPLARRHDRMRTRLVEPISEWPRGEILTLANGQRWELVRPGGHTFAAAPAGTEVTIRRGSLGSFVMRVGNRNQTLRVRRVD